MNIAILDLDSCNFRSVKSLVRETFERAEISVIGGTSDPAPILPDVLMIPGVSTFDSVVTPINASKVLTETIKNCVESNKVIIGVCAGAHALFEKSDESAVEVPGLSFLKGSVRKIASDLRSPHMGWNYLEGPITKSLPEQKRYVFFNHSFQMHPLNASVEASVIYGEAEIPAIVRNENIWAIQFHPERSGNAGLGILRRIIRGS